MSGTGPAGGNRTPARIALAVALVWGAAAGAFAETSVGYYRYTAIH
jgi:hypothetical protein